MIERKLVLDIIQTYKEAWVNQDENLIITIFHPDGEYGEYLLNESFKGHEEIKQYWKRKVIVEQSNIKFKLLNLYLDGDTAVAEWDATFYSNVEQKRIHIVEVAILEIEGEKIKRLREYWHSERLD